MNVFSNIELGGVCVKNRFVRSATWEGMATDEGFVTPKLAEYVRRVAEGGVGIVISSHAYVSVEGQAGPWQLGIYNDALIPGLSQLARAVVAFAQLSHAGANANAALSGMQPVAPSAIDGNARGEVPREMNQTDIERFIADFAEAARRAKDAGFDGVQIHAAHGYGLSQFLSPFYNRRTDRYGGSVANRARLLIEVYEAVRIVVGDDFPVTAKVNAEDFLEGGFTNGMMVETALMMEGVGFDAMEMSGGGVFRSKYHSSRTFNPASPQEETYYRDAARMYKARVKKMPLMLVGGIRSLEASEKILADGLADMIAMSRPFIREPNLIERWQKGDTTRAICLSCDGCRKPIANGEGLRCMFVC